MKVYALVGTSGTGKSYRAMTLASSRDIEFIIDDGLLIHGSKRLGGKIGQEREKLKIAAVKKSFVFLMKSTAKRLKILLLKPIPHSIFTDWNV